MVSNSGTTPVFIWMRSQLKNEYNHHSWLKPHQSSSVYADKYTRFVCIKLKIEQIFVFVNLLSEVLPLHIAVVTASEHAKEPAYDRERIVFLVEVDNLVLKFRSRILSVSERKSHNNSTSIFNRLFSYLYSCNVLAGLRFLFFGPPRNSFFYSRFSRVCTG